jgi:hypothetical protein
MRGIQILRNSRAKIIKRKGLKYIFQRIAASIFRNKVIHKYVTCFDLSTVNEDGLKATYYTFFTCIVTEVSRLDSLSTHRTTDIPRHEALRAISKPHISLISVSDQKSFLVSCSFNFNTQGKS